MFTPWWEYWKTLQYSSRSSCQTELTFIQKNQKHTEAVPVLTISLDLSQRVGQDLSLSLRLGLSLSLRLGLSLCLRLGLSLGLRLSLSMGLSLSLGMGLSQGSRSKTV